MPKQPITNRKMFFEAIRCDPTRKPADKAKRMLDWNQVDTALGPMAEPRLMNTVFLLSPLTNVDAVDAAFNSISEMDDSQFTASTGTGGQQIPVDFNL